MKIKENELDKIVNQVISSLNNKQNSNDFNTKINYGIFSTMDEAIAEAVKAQACLQLNYSTEAREKIIKSIRKNVSKHVEKVLKNGGSFEFQARLIRADKEIRFVQAYGEAEQNPDGKIEGLFGVFQEKSLFSL